MCRIRASYRWERPAANSPGRLAVLEQVVAEGRKTGFIEITGGESCKGLRCDETPLLEK
jgi:hypothetical protein